MAEWWERARCRGYDPELFFPPPGGDRADGALAVCNRCPVKEPCLREALTSGPGYEVYGIWGGLNQQQRRGLKVTADGRIVPTDGGRTCKRCGGAVPATAARAQRLCDTCRGPRDCEECGRRFQPANPEQATCSHRCAGLRIRRRTQERKRSQQRRSQMREDLEKVRAERPAPEWPPPAERPRADLARELATPAERSA